MKYIWHNSFFIAISVDESIFIVHLNNVLVIAVASCSFTIVFIFVALIFHVKALMPISLIGNTDWPNQSTLEVHVGVAVDWRCEASRTKEPIC